MPYVGAHGWVAGIASHGSGTQLRGWLAGLQWKPPDISGIQPPFSDAVKKFFFKKLKIITNIDCTGDSP